MNGAYFKEAVPSRPAAIATTPPPFTQKAPGSGSEATTHGLDGHQGPRGGLPFVAIDNEAPADHHDDGETAR